MNKKIMICCLLLLLTILAPLSSAVPALTDQQLRQQTVLSPQRVLQDNPIGILRKAYIVIYVVTFTPGKGIQPCQGADIHLRGFLHSYNGTTNEMGIYLFAVHTSLLREKIYLATVNIVLQNNTVTKRGFIRLHARQIIYKGFLFVVSEES
jgi:hypothetical protein